MNTQSIKHNIEIIANVGVLLGIILLAYEVNQNNELLAAEARTTHMQILSNSGYREAEDGELMELRVRSMQGEPLSLAEELRLVAEAGATLSIWAWEFGEHANGVLARLPVEAYIGQMRSRPHYMTAWRDWRTIFSPDFVAFMEENVISQLEK